MENTDGVREGDLNVQYDTALTGKGGENSMENTDGVREGDLNVQGDTALRGRAVKTVWRIPTVSEKETLMSNVTQP